MPPPPQVVLLEGWCLGFRALDESQLKECQRALTKSDKWLSDVTDVNAFLGDRQTYRKLHHMVEPLKNAFSRKTCEVCGALKPGTMADEDDSSSDEEE